MSVEKPKCPDCGVSLIVDDYFDNEFYENAHYENIAGHCPICDTTFTWTEKFFYSGFQDLASVKLEKG